MNDHSSDKGLFMPGLIWIAIVAVASLAAYLRGMAPDMFAPIAAIAALPSLLTLTLTPVLKREWAQLLVIFAWLSLAIAACLAFGFYPMAILFLIAPAIAALFEKEKVVESLIMAAILAAVIFFAERLGRLPDIALSAGQLDWGRQVGILGTLGLFITSIFGAAQKREHSRGLSSGTSAHSIVDSIDGLFLRFDKDEKLQLANREGQAIMGLDAPVDNFSLRSLFSQETSSNIIDAFMQAHKTGDRKKVSLNVNNANVHSGPLSALVTPLTDGGFSLYAPTGYSATDNAPADTGGTETGPIAGVADKNLFFAGVSHELRTPLNAIIGFSDMMRSRLFGPLPGKYAEYADLIHDSGQHMLDLIGDVLDLSKVEAGKYELHYDNFDAADVIRSTVKMIRPTADAAAVQLKIEIEDGDGLLMTADRKALRQIILNLLSNAIKYSPKGSDVVIAARSIAGTLNLSVQDKGMGMSPEDLAVIGQPYKQGVNSQRIEKRGSGLGLSLVKQLAELHGGRFAIASQAEIGTSVDIFIPLDKPQS